MYSPDQFGQIFADITTAVSSDGKVSAYPEGDTMLIVSTFKFSPEEPARIDRPLNDIRRLVGDGVPTKLTGRYDSENQGKFVVRITASFRM